MRRHTTFLALLLLTACGQAGDLYLPSEPAPAAQPAPAPSPPPESAPAEPAPEEETEKKDTP